MSKQDHKPWYKRTDNPHGYLFRKDRNREPRSYPDTISPEKRNRIEEIKYRKLYGEDDDLYKEIWE